MDLRDPPIDFTGLARAFGLTSIRIESAAEFDAAWQKALATNGPVLLEAMVRSVG